MACLLPLWCARPARAGESVGTSQGRAPELAEVLRFAAERAPEVVLAESDVEVGRAEYAGARLPPIQNPYAELTFQKEYGAAAQATSFLGSLWLPLEISGERSRRIAEADALLHWRRASLTERRARAVGYALQTYGRALALSARIDVLENVVEIAAREAELYRSRVELGDALVREAKLAEAEAFRAQALLQETRADVDAAIAALNRATGMNYQRPPAGELEPPTTSAGPELEMARNAPGPSSSAAEAGYLEQRGARASRESTGPVSVIVQAGRGALGEALVGGGLAYTFPAFRRNQAERARSDALRRRALVERELKIRMISQTVKSLRLELSNVRRAVRLLTEQAIPAQEGAVQAAVATQQGGKGDWLAVLVSRRDLGRLRLERLDLVEREWRLSGQITALTGVTP